MAPSITPSMTPTVAPSSTIPSALPTITGAVVLVDMNKLVTSSMTDDEISEILTETENTFGVYPGDVAVEVSYDVSGTISIATDGSDISDEDLVSALQDSIANSLNVHPSDVSVSVDSETGSMTYTINSASAEDASNLQKLLQDNAINDEISQHISNEIPEVTNVTFTPFNFKITISPLFCI